jgi:hypothetical protein
MYIPNKTPSGLGGGCAGCGGGLAGSPTYTASVYAMSSDPDDLNDYRYVNPSSTEDIVVTNMLCLLAGKVGSTIWSALMKALGTVSIGKNYQAEFFGWFQEILRRAYRASGATSSASNWKRAVRAELAKVQIRDVLWTDLSSTIEKSLGLALGVSNLTEWTTLDTIFGTTTDALIDANWAQIATFQTGGFPGSPEGKCAAPPASLAPGPLPLLNVWGVQAQKLPLVDVKAKVETPGSGLATVVGLGALAALAYFAMRRFG